MIDVNKDDPNYIFFDTARKINTEQILLNTKNLLTKTYKSLVEGFFEQSKQHINFLPNEKIDFFIFNPKELKELKELEIKSSQLTKMESKLDFITNKSYPQILNYIHKISNDINDFFS